MGHHDEFPNEPIAIIGTGCRFPGGASSPSKLWELLHTPRDLGGDIPLSRFDHYSFLGTLQSQRGYFLSEDHRHFDHQFFNIQPAEADTIDPQYRLLLECVYEALESAGRTITELQGSSTAVYTGLTSSDYANIVTRDAQAIPRYAATGTYNNMISNRISYFFDWRGPSMTIDTACSSSLVGVHQAVQALRNGEAELAVACGANLLLDPERFITASKLDMLSPTGRCQMWDRKADGFARGEGVAAILLKPLRQAIKDGDHVECVIRETGVNQDGRTQGITMPNAQAQLDLIRRTYKRAGLDCEDETQRCQYFEAHGTGTRGDAKEAEAIQRAFFDSESSSERTVESRPLYVGSVKTVMGHSEGCAGLAGLLKASLAIQNACIPPNFAFEALHPDVQPFCSRLEVPTTAIPWPKLESGVPRRASVNSFGFGGTNAHAILEQYIYSPMTNQQAETKSEGTPVLPFVFSSNSEQSLNTLLEFYVQFLNDDPTINLRDLSWTLHARRSKLSIRTYISASTVKELSTKLREKLAAAKTNPPTTLGIRAISSSRQARILGIFTGQGAQRPGMGKGLLKIPFAHRRFSFLEKTLADLPRKDRPKWSLIAELQAEEGNSQVQRADISQPLHAALQIVLVDLLCYVGVRFHGVVGHSSGEITAAYAAGFLEAADAIRIAYYRGLCAQTASKADGPKGAMITAYVPHEEANALIKRPELLGRISIAAVNSSSSVTLSGDVEAVTAASNILTKSGHSSRPLRVDVAYHSPHMRQCAESYSHYLASCDIQVLSPSSNHPIWYSSVDGWGRIEQSNSQGLSANYWIENLLGTVHFSQAISSNVEFEGACDLGIEIGAHPMLKGAVSETISEAISSSSIIPDNAKKTSFPYMGVLQNEKDDLESISDTLGFIWGHSGAPSSLSLDTYSPFLLNNNKNSQHTSRKLLKNLPAYPWDHNRLFWNESRRSQLYRTGGGKFNNLLGIKSPESTEDEHRWTNVLTPGSIASDDDSSSIQTRRLLLPVAVYISMALESCMLMAAGRRIGLMTIEDLEVIRPVFFESSDSRVETLFSLTSTSNSRSCIAAEFKIYAVTNDDESADLLKLVARGKVTTTLGISAQLIADPEAVMPNDSSSNVNVDEFYHSFDIIGQGKARFGKLLSALKRTPSGCVGFVKPLNNEVANKTCTLHPSMLEGMTHAVLAALWSTTSDQQSVASGNTPTKIDYIAVNPSLCALTLSGRGMKTFGTAHYEKGSICGNAELLARDTSQTVARMEGITFQSRAVASGHFIPHDAPLLSKKSAIADQPSTLKQEILKADTKKAAVKLLLSTFIDYLCRTLQFSEDERDKLEEVPLVELGVDSLVAMDIRSWFQKEISSKVSVLDVLGGSSALELVSSAVGKIFPGRLSATDSFSNEISQSLNPPHFDIKLSRPTSSSGNTEGSFVMVDNDLVQAPELPMFEWVGPLSQAQSRYWFVHSSLDNPTALNVSFYFHFVGQLRIPDLEAAVHALGERHEALRTCYFIQDERPVQGIMTQSHLALEKKAISSKEDVALEFEGLKNNVYDLRQGHTMRMVLLTESPTSNYLLFGYHHLVMDGFSFQQVFLPELEKLYSQTSLTPSVRQFREHSQAEHDSLQNGDMSAEIAFWKAQFHDLPPVLPLFPMSKIKSRSVLSQYDHRQIDLVLNASITARLRTVAQSLQASPFHIYLTLYQALLFKMLEIDDICIGIADANRVDEKDAGVIGLYLNFLPLRFRRNKEHLFSDAVKNTRNTTYNALANSRLPFDALLKELRVPSSAKHTPLFQAFMNYRSAQAEKGSFADLQGRSQDVQYTKAAYDIGLDIGENVNGETCIAFLAQASLYSQSDAEMIRRSYHHLLEVFLLQPSNAIEECSAYNPQDVQRALDLGRGRLAISEWPETLIHQVEAIAQDRGSNIAVKDANNSLTYAELGRRSTNIARTLLEQGVCPGERVAVFQEPSVDWICSLLGIMRAGAIYVPLDLRNPISRLQLIVNTCNPAAILAHRATVTDVKNLKANLATIIDISKVNDDSSADFSGSTTTIRARANSPAVILFTSGSTGIPKGISLTHASLRCAIESLSKTLNLDDRQVVLQHSAYTFDISIAQIFLGIVTGGTVYVASKSQRGDPVALAKLIQTEKISYVKGTSSELLSIIRYGTEYLSQNISWQYAVCGGEPFIETLREEFRKASLPQLRLFNAYGPAETTVISSIVEIPYSSVEKASSQTSIGFPLPNYSLCIVDDNLNPVPIGVSGEVLIGGGSVAMGYLDNEELSRSRFIPDRYASPEFHARGWRTAFRTGDQARMQADGSFIFEGRVAGDTLIKLRGLRIDLGDIESTALATANGVLSEVAVSVRGDPEFLVGHIVISPAHAASDLDVDSFLQDLLLKLPLPLYMKPAIMIPVKSLPMTIHGKRDRKAIATLPLGEDEDIDDEDSGAETPDSIADDDLTETEDRLRDIWLTILPADAVSAHQRQHQHENGKKRLAAASSIDSNTSFFDAGGNSLLLAPLQAEIKKAFSVMLPIKLLMEACAEGLGELADMVEAAQA